MVGEVEVIGIFVGVVIVIVAGVDTGVEEAFADDDFPGVTDMNTVFAEDEAEVADMETETEFADEVVEAAVVCVLLLEAELADEVVEAAVLCVFFV